MNPRGSAPAHRDGLHASGRWTLSASGEVGEFGEPTQVHRATFGGATTDIQFAPGFDFATNPFATSTFGGRCPGGASWVIFFAGTGHGTHLGQFTWTSSHCTRLLTLAPPQATITDGRLDFVAANGDVLHEDYVGAGPIATTGSVTCAPTRATFNGGTGRFRHATGNADEQGCWPASEPGPVLADLRITSVGTIAFDASDRP